MELLRKMWAWAGKKLIVMAVAGAAASLKMAYPEWPIPDEQFIKDLTIAFLSAHTLTDVVAILKTAGKELASGRAGVDAKP